MAESAGGTVRQLPDGASLRAALCAPRGGWAQLSVVAATGSTNADLAAAARAGAVDRSVLLAHAQDSGRGRRMRTWTSPPGAGLACSVLLRPTGVPTAALGWIPLLVGVAVVDAVRSATGLPAALKWPNDVLVGERKLGGILAELVAGPEGPAVVVGLGLNVSLAEHELPVRWATSLSVEGVAIGADEVAVAVLSALDARERPWRAAAGDAAGSDLTGGGLAADYRARCATLGRQVTVELAGAEPAWLVGVAEDVDGAGRLVVRTASGERTAVSAGDVTHVRPAD